MRKGDYSWDLLPNSGGFVLRETGTDYNCVNQLGGAGGSLKFLNSESSLTDESSTFRVEDAMDVVDGIGSIHNSQFTIHNEEVYDLSGRKMFNVQSSMFNGRKKGVYIIRTKDGTTKKTMIK